MIVRRPFDPRARHPAAGGAGARPRGITCVLRAVTCFVTQDSMIKWLSDTYPLHEVVLARAALAALLTLAVMRLEGGLHLLRTARPAMHIPSIRPKGSLVSM